MRPLGQYPNWAKLWTAGDFKDVANQICIETKREKGMGDEPVVFEPQVSGRAPELRLVHHNLSKSWPKVCQKSPKVARLTALWSSRDDAYVGRLRCVKLDDAVLAQVVAVDTFWCFKDQWDASAVAIFQFILNNLRHICVFHTE